MNKFIAFVFIAFFTLSSNAEILKVGVTAGPHAEIMKFVAERAKSEELEIKIIEFNDFILPNMALAQGDIDVNSYQHQPFLDEQIHSRKYTLTSIGKTIILPMGGYSKKLKTIDELKDKSKIGIPNDPTNGGRALLLLEKVGLIKLKEDSSLLPSMKDIQENKKNIKIIELEAPQLPRAIDDLDIALINTDWVLVSNMDPHLKIFSEDKNSPYANILATTIEKKEQHKIKKLLALYQSNETKDFISNKYKNLIITAW